MNTITYKTILNPVLATELRELGQSLRLLRLKRHITITEMCTRIGVKNPRTVSKIENGDPTVALGTFIQYINILNLANHLSQKILGDYVDSLTIIKKKRVFSDEDLDF